MITDFSNTDLKALRRDLVKALEQVSIKHGIELELGAIRYSQEEATVKLTMITKTKAVNNQNFPNKGVKFMYGGEIYVVTNYKPRSHKYPYIGTNVQGKSFKFSVGAVLNNKIQTTGSN